MRSIEARLKRLEREVKRREPWNVFVVLPEDLHVLYKTDAEREHARAFLRSGQEAVYGIRAKEEHSR